MKKIDSIILLKYSNLLFVINFFVFWVLFIFSPWYITLIYFIIFGVLVTKFTEIDTKKIRKIYKKQSQYPI